MRTAVTLGRHGPAFAGPTAEAAAAAEWRARQHIRFEGFLDDELRAFARTQIERGEFADFVHDASGHEGKMADNAAVWLLDFLMNSPPLLECVSRLTGRDVSWFHGRVYRLTPGTDEGHDWHSDYEIGRQLGVSINLTPTPFSGGVLQLRDAATGSPISEVANTGYGDCVIFRLGADIVHRVLPVTGTVERVAYAGWFYSGPTLFERLARQLDYRGR